MLSGEPLRLSHQFERAIVIASVIYIFFSRDLKAHKIVMKADWRR
jgi:hypothetical protein